MLAQFIINSCRQLFLQAAGKGNDNLQSSLVQWESVKSASGWTLPFTSPLWSWNTHGQKLEIHLLTSPKGLWKREICVLTFIVSLLWCQHPSTAHRCPHLKEENWFQQCQCVFLRGLIWVTVWEKDVKRECNPNLGFIMFPTPILLSCSLPHNPLLPS